MLTPASRVGSFRAAIHCDESKPDLVSDLAVSFEDVGSDVPILLMLTHHNCGLSRRCIYGIRWREFRVAGGDRRRDFIDRVKG